MNYPKQLLYFILFISTFSFSQEAIWSPVSSNNRSAQEQKSNNSKLFYLDLTLLNNQLKYQKKGPQASNPSISFPNTTGEISNFSVVETHIMHPELAAKYPNIKTYRGNNQKGETIYFSISQYGLNTLLHTSKGSQYIEPVDIQKSIYKVAKRQNTKHKIPFSCSTIHPTNNQKKQNAKPEKQTNETPTLRVYRMAMAATIEYSNFHINKVNAQNKSIEEKKEAVLSAIITTLTRVNAVFNRDLAVGLQLVPDNDQIIFIESDQLNNDHGEKLLGQIQNVIDNIIGSSNYDIGHVVSTGGGGVANLESVCTSNKARGVTGLESPTGDTFDIDFVSHEIGHQFGAHHTFNNSCSGGINTNTSYEPGSGSTIMAYAGICPINPISEKTDTNVQSNSDDYFHAISIKQINNFIQNQATCSQNTILNNMIPIVNAGNDYTIPHSTPFKLTGQVTDNDQNLTYCWEQFDKGLISGKPNPIRTTGANFRSLPPTTSPIRYFPKWESNFNNIENEWEIVPEVSREMNFILSVRDNNPEGGLIGQDQMKITTSDQGPFRITSQNSINTCLVQSIDYRISWDVAGTDSNAINTSNVNIKLSNNDGNTFDFILASNTPNDGEEIITIPQVFCDKCRLLIEPTNNIYYAVSPNPFSIGIDNGCLNDFIIYDDNPNDNKIQYQYKAKTNQHPIKIVVYNILGKQVFSEWYHGKAFIENSINTGNLSNGVYILHLQEYTHSTIKKFVVSNTN